MQTKFNYGWGLIKSPLREHQVEGVRLLTGRSHDRVLLNYLTMSFENAIELYREEPTRRRECLYYLSLGHYKMGNYQEAKRLNGAQQASFVWSDLV